MDWISIIAIVFIVLRVISKGGDWIDIMQGHADYDNRWASRQFDFLLGALGVGVLAMFAFLSLPDMIAASADTPTQRAAMITPVSSRTRVANRKAPHKVSAKIISRKTHTAPVHH